MTKLLRRADSNWQTVATLARFHCVMRRLRRFAALLLGVVLLPATTLGAVAACIAADDTVTHGITHEAAGAESSHGSAHDAHHAPRGDETPNRDATSCPMAMACAGVDVVAAELELDASHFVRTADVIPLDDARLITPRSAPEPPPPRVART